MPASLDDKAEPDREVTDRRPALLEVMAMTTSSFQAAVVVEKGQGKEQDERTTKERVSLGVGKLFFRQTKVLITGQRLTGRCSFIDLQASQGGSPSPSENRGLT